MDDAYAHANASAKCKLNTKVLQGEASAERYPFHFMLTCGSHPLKWTMTHFSLTVADLCVTGWSGRTSGLSGSLSSLLIWCSPWLVQYWGQVIMS